MEIRAPQAVAASTALNPNEPKLHTLSWQLGQLLQARVMSASEGRVVLDLAGQRLTADTQLVLQPGTQLTLKVSALTPQPVLTLQNQNPLIMQAYDAIRLRLVQQQGWGALLPALQQTASMSGASTERVAQLLQDLPTPAQISQPAGLSQAIQSTGLFWEAALLMQGKAGTRDLKAGLLRLWQALREGGAQANADHPDALAAAPPTPASAPQSQLPAADEPTLTANDLLMRTQALLARLELAQLSAVVEQAQGQLTWLLDLPVRHEDQVDIWQLRIRREAPVVTLASPSAWRVELAYALPELGAGHIWLTLQDQQVSILFWCEQAHATTHLTPHLPRLREMLTAQGLQVANLACRIGEPPQEQAPARLMDVRA
jgi:hypothetical protein